MTIAHQHVGTNDITLHVASAGSPDDPLVVFLHGFPEGWFAWRRYLPRFADAGYRAIAPDQRGYGDSDKPVGRGDYHLDVLADDIIGLIDGEAKKKAYIVGHDWGAAVAWWLALRHPDRVEKLAVLNVPHPWVMRQFLMKSPRQVKKSWYMFFFQIPGVPERAFRADGGRKLFERVAKIGRKDTFSDEDRRYFLEAWAKHDAPRGMLSWYRAIASQIRVPPDIDPTIDVPTLVLWGRQDELLDAGMVEPSVELCNDGRVVWFDDATHWVNHEEERAVGDELLRFFDR